MDCFEADFLSSLVEFHPQQLKQHIFFSVKMGKTDHKYWSLKCLAKLQQTTLLLFLLLSFKDNKA